MRPTALLLAAATLLWMPLPARAGELEQEIERALASAYRASGSPAPASDPALGAAALRLAERALEGGVRQAVDAEATATELSRAGAWDPPPRSIAVRTGSARRAAAAMAARSDLASAPATHYGLGLARGADGSAAVLLLSSRRAWLDPFPRQVAVGASQRLSGKLVFPLHDARVFVTGPSGHAAGSAAGGAARHAFESRVGFPSPGLYTVEVVALFRVQAGKARPAAAAPRVEAERDDLAKALSQVLEALNARRRSRRLGPLARSALLDSVAQAHAAEMVRLDYFAHVSPISGDVAQRVVRAGFAYQRISENLGEAETALEAQRLIEASPGHLANVLDPEVELVGLGAARVTRGSVENVLLVEVFARPGR